MVVLSSNQLRDVLSEMFNEPRSVLWRLLRNVVEVLNKDRFYITVRN